MGKHPQLLRIAVIGFISTWWPRAVGAQNTPHCFEYIVEQLGPLKPINFGDVVEITFSSGNQAKIKATYIGQLQPGVRANALNVFSDFETNSIHLIPDSKTFFPSANLERNSLDPLPKFVTVEKDRRPQDWPKDRDYAGSCLSHAVYNCVRQLKLLKQDNQLTALLDHKLESSELFKKLRGALNDSVPHLQGWRIQRIAALALLKENGVGVKETFDREQLISHLSKGGLAIINFPAELSHHDKPRIKNYDDGAVNTLPTGWVIPTTNRQQILGGHSILAVGYLNAGALKKRFLVLDSATGTFHLIKEAWLPEGSGGKDWDFSYFLIN